MASALTEKFGGKKRAAPKFEDDGPPSGSDESRGAGGKSDEDTKVSSSMPPSDDDMGGDPSSPDAGGGPDDPMAGGDPEEQAADDLADILGVGPDDREDFGNALKAYVAACVAKNMAAPPPDMGMPPMPGGSDVGGGPPSGY